MSVNTTKSITILLADDHPLVRAGIRELLSEADAGARMKTNKTIITILSIALFLSACQSKASPSPTTFSPASVSTKSVSTQQQKEAIIQEIHEIVNQYNAFLEEEKATGNYIIVQLPDGSEGVQFTNESAGKVFTEMMRIDEIITGLNEKYYELSMKEQSSISYPSPEIQASDLGRLTSEYLAWIDEEQKNGTTIIIVTDDGFTRTLFIGDSYVASKEWNRKIDIAEEKSNQEYLAYINPEPDYQIIRKIEGDDVQIRFKDVTTSPYRPDTPYTVYETATMRYNIDSRQRLVTWIEPIISPQGVEELPVAELEKMTREMIALVSPEINLDALTYSFGQKIGTYFFRWEDPTKPVLDDGRSYPFVQVGLNGKGELLNYINTLPMAR